jgi:putative FmdB family regulatory protein
MPLYEYQCDHCNYKFDKLVISGKDSVKCPLCRGKVKKLMSTFAVGASHSLPAGMPTTAAPMCRSCGTSAAAFNKN